MGDHDDLIARLREERGADTPHARYLDERLTEAMRENAELRAENKRLREHLAGDCKAGAALRSLWGAIDGLAGAYEGQRKRDEARAADPSNAASRLQLLGLAHLKGEFAAELRHLLVPPVPPSAPPEACAGGEGGRS